MPYVPPGATLGQPPIPAGWTYDDWMVATPDQHQTAGAYGPFDHQDVRFWLRKGDEGTEVGFNIDNDSEADIWVDVDQLEELEGPALQYIEMKASEILS